MSVKLFTIGDSISQGFMSGAAARTDLAYSTIIANELGINNYNFPEWPKDGLPFNLETIFRRLQKRLGEDISGIFEWPIAINIINYYLDEIEDYYERGEGSLGKSVGSKPFHNVSVRGFDLSNSWQVKPSTCREIISQSKSNGDNFFGMVNESFLRTAHKVLQSGSPKNKDFSQLDWLNHHHQTEGVENVILWLGANNALGTVLDLKINQTSQDGTAFKNGIESLSYKTRTDKKWNLWHPGDFRIEYDFMMDKVISMLENNPHNADYKVFIATIPLVTVCPLIKSVEKYGRNELTVKEWEVDPNNPCPMNLSQLSEPREHDLSYGKYYPYFIFEDNFDITLNHLNQQEVYHIDNFIRKYNRIIQEAVAKANERIGKPRFYLVDIATEFNKMALKRNNYNPIYEFPEYFSNCFPKIDTRYYGVTREGVKKAGGLFSLDGVHPTAIGQGLIAFEFLKVMKKAGTYKGNPDKLDWKKIFDSDDLYNKPIKLLGEIYDNPNLKKWIYKKLSNRWENEKF